VSHVASKTVRSRATKSHKRQADRTKSKKSKAVAKPKIGRTPSVQKITTFLTFNDQAEEAMKLYTSIFKKSKILGLSRYGEEGPGPKGTVMSGTFELEGQPFIALNGGPYFTFAQGISLFVNCESQAEVDDLWERLSEGGEKQPCGWLKDRFGVSWQIIPSVLGEMLQDKDPRKAGRVMQAMLKMEKIEIRALQKAYDNR
jgi:predicted 3-demethylubiquinone-9 3-methyltransferase (glyoxalase superfamily)